MSASNALMATTTAIASSSRKPVCTATPANTVRILSDLVGHGCGCPLQRKRVEPQLEARVLKRFRTAVYVVLAAEAPMTKVPTGSLTTAIGLEVSKVADNQTKTPADVCATGLWKRAVSWVNLARKEEQLHNINTKTLRGEGMVARKASSKAEAAATAVRVAAADKETAQRLLTTEEEALDAAGMDGFCDQVDALVEQEDRSRVEKQTLGTLHERLETAEKEVAALTLTQPKAKARQMTMMKQSFECRAKARASCPAAPWLTNHLNTQGAASAATLNLPASEQTQRLDNDTGVVLTPLAQAATKRQPEGDLVKGRRVAVAAAFRLGMVSDVLNVMLWVQTKNSSHVYTSSERPVIPAAVTLLLAEPLASTTTTAAASSSSSSGGGGQPTCTPKKRKPNNTHVWTARRGANSKVNVKQDPAAAKALRGRSLPTVTVHAQPCPKQKEIQRLEALLEKRDAENKRLVEDKTRLAERIAHNQPDTALGQRLRAAMQEET